MCLDQITSHLGFVFVCAIKTGMQLWSLILVSFVPRKLGRIQNDPKWIVIARFKKGVSDRLGAWPHTTVSLASGPS